MSLALAGCQAQIDPREQGGTFERPDPDPDSPLIGTRWHWGDWTQRYIYFETDQTAVYTDNGSSSNWPYWYNKTTRRGELDYYGTFSVTADFQRLVFSPRWGEYKHDALFTRVHE